MISWISGELIDLWQVNNKFFILINCQGLGYEIQILEPFFLKIKKNHISKENIILWLKHVKKEDSDMLFGFASKDQRDFFINIINIKGIGSQIGMGLLNKFSVLEVINAINSQNKNLISSVPGIGQKMTERLILELKGKFKNELQIENEKNYDDLKIKNTRVNKLFSDLELTLKSLNYTKREINNILPTIIKETDVIIEKGKNISFENLLKLAMNYLDNNSSNIVG